MQPSFSKRFFAILILSLAVGSASAEELIVSAAASLTNAFKALGPVFEAQHPGTKVLFNFAASDALVQQIAKGAPVDVFASADQEAMDKAQTQQLLVSGTRKNFVGNSLVLIVPADSTLAIATVADLTQATLPASPWVATPSKHWNRTSSGLPWNPKPFWRNRFGKGWITWRAERWMPALSTTLTRPS